MIAVYIIGGILAVGAIIAGMVLLHRKKQEPVAPNPPEETSKESARPAHKPHTKQPNPKKVRATLKDRLAPTDIFLIHLDAVLERNLSNPDLTVEQLTNEMAMGRTVFFIKLKNLTEMSPVEYIRETRIKKAAQLLEKDDLTIMEITYRVGMSDSRYFSKCFKNTYGVTPTEYRQQAKKQK